MTATRLAQRALVRLSTDDPAEDLRGFLQGLVTNDVMAPPPVYAALLSAQGKTLFDFLVWAQEDGSILLDCEAEHAAELAKRLSLYRLRRKIDIGLAPDLAVHWQAEGEAGSADPRLLSLGRRWIAPPGEEGAADEAWLVHRLKLGVPEGRGEMGDILWLETNAVELHGVAFDKGCYIGQENTARMNWRQKVNRRLVVVPMDRSEEKRRRAAYPVHGLAVDHLRVANLDPAQLPAWQAAAIMEQEQAPPAN